MIFSTYSFIFIFLPAVFFSYSLALAYGKVTLSKIALVLASLFFYAYGTGDFFPWFIISIVFNYVVGSNLLKLKNRPWTKKVVFYIGIAGNLLLLGYYKYTDFLIFNFNAVFNCEFPYQSIILPIGISFFTFQLVAYLVDSYRGKTEDYSFLNYLLFITFFPQLIVGPIVHHKEMVPQFDGLKKSFLNSESIAKGVFLFSIGCAKKILLADPLSEWAQKGFDHAQSLTSLESWFSSLSYTFSYYFDLSGYADMAIGLGLIFGIALPFNFNSPYKARNFADYWRRWHITLSRFLGDYIFRNIFDKDKGAYNFYIAIFITFLVSGFWHGSGWTFVLWGCINGVFVMMSHAMIRAGIRLPLVIAWLLTFFGVVSTRILFVSHSYQDAEYVWLQLFKITPHFSLSGTYVSVTQLVYLVIAFVLVLGFRNSNQLLEKFKPNVWSMASVAILLLVSILNMSYVRGFLYFKF